MLIFCREDQTEAERQAVVRAAQDAEFHVQPVGRYVLALFGDGDLKGLEDLPGVERLAEAPEAPLLASRGTRIGTTPVVVGPVTFGREFVIIAGPCAVEDRSPLLDLAHAVKEAGVQMLRGGAYKPRTSPYSFQGLGPKGLDYLREAREATGLPVVTEALDTADVERVAECADMIQIGTRNMMNYALLRKVGRAGKPVFLKRGMAATLPEFLMAAEYLLVEGCPGVVLCERGVRAFGTRTRFTLDLCAVPALREDTHLPVVVDPSHGTGVSRFVPPMARAAAAVGAHGVMVEVHFQPHEALSDKCQALLPGQLGGLVRELREIAAVSEAAEAQGQP